MKYIKIVLLLMIISFLALYAQEEDKSRPKIGLVLSGGGARGIAHIGVLKVLEELGIEPDFITGTSMGSVIGGLYAIGYQADQLEEIVLDQDWQMLLMDETFREDISIEEKKYDERYVGNLPIIDCKLVLPAGIVGGHRISKLFADLTISALHINDFSRFRTPFRCIATNIETGEAVVLDHGFLPEAMRTSMSIPSAFTPVKDGEKLLVDGGLARNLPVIDAIDMGADIIIAVDVSSKLYEKEDLNTLIKVMEQSVNFRGLERTKEQHKLCDLIIFPKVKKYGMISFDSCDSLITLGEFAARNSYDKLKTIADEQKKFEKPNKGIPLLKVEKLFINKINIKGLKAVSKNLVIGKLRINENSFIKTENLSKAIDRLYGSQFFERVTYRLIPVSNGVNLEVRVIEKYKHVLNFSFQYNSDTKSAILLNETMRNVLFQGSRLIWDIKLSENPTHALSYFIHTGWKPGFGIGTEILYDQFEVPVQAETGIDHYEYTNISGKLVLQTVFSNNSVLGVGIQQERNIFESIDREPAFNFKADATKIYTFFEFDTLNRTLFPQYGFRLQTSFSSYIEPKCDIEFFEYDPFNRILIDIDRYRMFHKKLSLFYGYSATFIVSDIQLIPPNFYAYLGGIDTIKEGLIQFYGLRRMAILAENAAVFKVGIQYNVWKSFYLIPCWNTGKASNDIEDVFSIKDVISGFGLTGALKTPFGSIEYTASKSSENDEILQFWSVGYKF
ncbi:MAG: patatin-like phospholipase family protein [Candidatus Cloacimonetes bacterium]|nr:patatin-like phospholipase family protein [Candidatus Cloacimonadota bacterium]